MLLLKVLLLPSQVVKSIPLTHGLLSELLVLGMDVPLNLLDVTLCMHKGSPLVFFEFLSQLGLLLFSHLCETDVDSVLFLLDGLLNTLTVLLHQQQSSLELDTILALFVHLGQDLVQLLNLGVNILLLVLSSVLDLVLL